MRTKGKIPFWKGEKGYGFITPESGAKQVFVHINAFADKSKRPQINQQVLRHKSKKEEFRFVFWLTVVVNVAVFLWLFTDSGSAMLSGLLGQLA